MASTPHAPPAPKHRRDAAATRAAILEAARHHFARAGYDHVGVREIAAQAGVTAALVNRYFGSKEQLFAEVLTSGLSLDALLPEQAAEIGGTIARWVAAKRVRSEPQSDPLALLLRSVTNPTAAELLRARVDGRMIEPLARRLEGEDAELRAALFVGSIIGLGVVRRMLRSHAFSGVSQERLIERLTPVLEACLGTGQGCASSRDPSPDDQ